MAELPTPNMGIVVPTVSGDLGPAWAVTLNEAIAETVDEHDHSSGKGVRVGVAGLSITGDLAIGASTSAANNLTNVKSVRFGSQGATLGGPSDVDCLYVSGDNLYYNNQGTPVQITSGASVNNAAVVSNTWAQSSVLAVDTTISPASTYIDVRINTGAARIITLPLAAAVSAGRYYVITDFTGSASAFPVSLALQGSDVFVGGATTAKLEYDGGALIVESDGVSKWSVRALRGATAQANSYAGETRIRRAPSAGYLKALEGMWTGDLCLVASGAAVAPIGLFMFVDAGAEPTSADVTLLKYEANDSSGMWWRVDGYTWGASYGVPNLDANGRLPAATVTLGVVGLDHVESIANHATTSGTYVDVPGAVVLLEDLAVDDEVEILVRVRMSDGVGIESAIITVTEGGGLDTDLPASLMETTFAADATQDYSASLFRTVLGGGDFSARVRHKNSNGIDSVSCSVLSLSAKAFRP